MISIIVIIAIILLIFLTMAITNNVLVLVSMGLVSSSNPSYAPPRIHERLPRNRSSQVQDANKYYKEAVGYYITLNCIITLINK